MTCTFFKPIRRKGPLPKRLPKACIDPDDAFPSVLQEDEREWGILRPEQREGLTSQILLDSRGTWPVQLPSTPKAGPTPDETSARPGNAPGTTMGEREPAAYSTIASSVKTTHIHYDSSPPGDLSATDIGLIYGLPSPPSLDLFDLLLLDPTLDSPSGDSNEYQESLHCNERPSFTPDTPLSVSGFGEVSVSAKPPNDPLHPMSPPTGSPAAFLLHNLDSLIIPRLQEYYRFLYPTLPLIPASAVFRNIHSLSHTYPWSNERLTDPAFMALVLAKVALATVHDYRRSDTGHSKKPLEVPQLLHEISKLDFSRINESRLNIEIIFASYLMFLTYCELGMGEAATIRLRESAMMSESMRLPNLSTYSGLSLEEQRRRSGMLSLLVAAER
ncbi:hypothetical protein BJY00DRAFT_320000 [Aspergillus carlsbadensis]|nr:hypothetical protein BJY00DRAFT_320000 [Aspergillus carlsbadensis]